MNTFNPRSINPANNYGGINPQLTTQITQGINPQLTTQLTQGHDRNTMAINNLPFLQNENVMRQENLHSNRNYNLAMGNNNNNIPIFLGYNANNLNTSQLTNLFTNLAKSYRDVCSGKDRMNEENSR